MYEDFLKFLDALYWEGYARQLAEEDPKAFKWEMNWFYDNYQLKPESV